ncbi:MAG: Ppx/GppA family phosphatase [Sphingomonadaceae bacterium]
MSDRHAIIDIGSNTIRLVVNNGPPRAPVVLLNEKVTPRLGRDVEATGMLAEDSMETALAALARYAALLDMLKIEQVQTVATAAARDASNGGEFLRQVRKLGLDPRLLSGEEEARYSAMGVLAAFPGASGTCGDLGGGSLELTHVDAGECGKSITLPLGTLRIPPLRKKGDEAFSEHIAKALKDAGWKAIKGEAFYIAGGSWRALATYAMEEAGWPLDDPHDFELEAGDAIRLCKRLASKGPQIEVPRISSARLATLPDAAALLGVLVERLKPSRIVFSSWGLREGLHFSALGKKTQALDPMIAGIENFAAGYAVDSDTARAVDTWIAGALPEETGQDRALRLAAVMLSLATMRGEPNMRAEQALNWALRKRWIGLDARGRAMIGMAVLANSNLVEPPEALLKLAAKTDLTRAAQWGLAVRLCRKLSGGALPALAGTSLRLKGGTVSLHFDEAARELASSSVTKNLRRLADAMGLDWKLVGAET